MQRTRSSPSALRSPLMRCPLGGRNQRERLRGPGWRAGDVAPLVHQGRRFCAIAGSGVGVDAPKLPATGDWLESVSGTVSEQVVGMSADAS